MVKIALALVVGLLAGSPCAGARTASYLAFECRDPEGLSYDSDLCRVDADGRAMRHLTRNAVTTSDYLYPSLSAGGHPRLAFAFGYPEPGVFVARADASGRRSLGGSGASRVAISPSGGRVAYVETREPLPGEPQGQSIPVLFTVRSDGSGRRQWGRRLTDPTWLGNRLVAVRGGLDGGPEVCILREGTRHCERTVARLPGGYIRTPAISPDRKLLAAVAERDSPFLARSIWVFRTKTAKVVGDDVGGLVAGGPAWSPDGRALAYTDESRLYVQQRPPAAGRYILVSSGAERPVWGGVGGTRSTKLRVTGVSVDGRDVTVRGTIASGVRRALRLDFWRTGSTGREGIIWRRARSQLHAALHDPQGEPGRRLPLVRPDPVVPGRRPLCLGLR